jgi:hypothetical protein
MPRQLRRDDVPRIDTAAIGAFESANLGGFDAPDVAVNL